MKTLVLFIALPLCAATTITIDAGAATEQNCAAIPAGSAPCFSGGYAYTVQPSPSGDTTLRYGWAKTGDTVPPFSYSIPVDSPGAYQIDLNFMEPSSTGVARAFSVTINDKLVYPRLTMPGFLAPFTRSTVEFSAGGFINIRFDTITRGAVISSIQVSPFAVTQYIKPSDPKTARITGAVPVWFSDGYYVPRPAIEPDSTVWLLYQNVEVFRNGIRQLESNQSAAGADFLVTSVIGQLKLVPVSGQAWPSTDTIVVNYIAVWPPAPQPIAMNIIRQRCARCHGGDLTPGDTHLVGGLDLRTRDLMLTGGDRGPALVPGSPEQSLIYRFAAHPQYPTATPEETLALTTTNDDSEAMPPFFPLPRPELQIIRDWIANGAPK